MGLNDYMLILIHGSLYGLYYFIILLYTCTYFFVNVIISFNLLDLFKHLLYVTLPMTPFLTGLSLCRKLIYGVKEVAVLYIILKGVSVLFIPISSISCETHTVVTSKSKRVLLCCLTVFR